jgi:hypothetical protein
VSEKTTKRVKKRIQESIQKEQHKWLVQSWVNTLREPFITRLKLAIWLLRGENKKKQITVKQ